MTSQDAIDDIQAIKASCSEHEWTWSPTLTQESIAAWEARIDPLTDSDPVSPPFLPPPAFSVLINTDPEARINIMFEAMKTTPDCSASGPSLTRQAQSLLKLRLDQALGDIAPLRLFNIVERMRQIVPDDPELLREFADCHSHVPHPDISITPRRPTSVIIKQLLFWSHHLKATSKRKDIVQWGSELGLWGISKPGYPGVFFVEGLAEDVDEFASRIKRLNWQALQVRCEDTQEVPMPDDAKIDPRTYARERCRLAPTLGEQSTKGPTVVEVESMADVASRLDDAGLHSMFLSAMKLQQ